MVGILISTADLQEARARAERLCDLAMQTDERTWQALAWEARARVALSSKRAADAADCVTNALAATKGAQVPLAEWRVHATAASVHKAGQDLSKAKTHARLGLAVRKQVAESLPEGHPLRLIFESRSAVFFNA
jgi:hypothetical protein